MDDLINRQDAIDRINKQREHLQPDIYPQDKIGDAAYRICAEFIERLPSAQPKIEERKEESAQNVSKEDLISRKAAIDGVKTLHEVAWKNWHEPTLSSNTVIDMIKDLPPAQPEPQWIPVSERLPEVGKDVMVCYDFKGHRSVLIGVLYGDEKFHGYDDEYLTPEGRKYRKAVAWMPLPEPYRAERRTDGRD